MTTYAQKQIQLAVDVDYPERTASFDFYRGGALKVSVAFFKSGTLLDVSNLTTASLRIKSLSDLTGDALMSETITELDSDLTLADWLSGDSAHAVFEFTAAETLLDLGDQASVRFHLVIYGQGTDVVIHTTSTVLCLESGVDGSAPAVPESYYTKDEVDAIIANL